jgi:hypothetical protein
VHVSKVGLSVHVGACVQSRGFVYMLMPVSKVGFGA